MIYKLLSHKPKHMRILFELPAGLWADRVFLVGDFNAWNPKRTPFTQDRDGLWRVTVDLPTQNSYAFRYLIDGLWHCDYHADDWVANWDDHPASIVHASAADVGALL
ncbi:MAG: isoamylase early set domain-containing protein [Caldilineaceae bacterium]